MPRAIAKGTLYRGDTETESGAVCATGAGVEGSVGMSESETPARSFDDAVSDLLKQTAAHEQTQARREAESKAANRKRYVALLWDQDADAVDAVLEAAKALGLGPVDRKRDSEAVRQAIDLDAVAKTAGRWMDKLVEANAQLLALNERHIQERLKALHAQKDAENAYDDAVRAERELKALKAQRPELFT